jgi:hypoxanthine phosphoribosyltransferase
MSQPQLRILFDEAAIARRVAELAGAISRDCRDLDELVLIGVLRGAFIFLADLSRRLETPQRVDFVALESYGQSTTPGDVRVLLDLREKIEGRHVLVVDDIVDTGATLAHLCRLLAARRPASLRTCVLTRKAKRRDPDVRVDYVGFEIPDVWVVGYGLDCADRYRTLPYIAVLPVAP